jgi:hypothetical protein
MCAEEIEDTNSTKDVSDRKKQANRENARGSSGPNLALGQNQIQEATVISTEYSGQFGGAAGGNINYVTKSGSYEFHGNAQYFWNGRIFNANDWFNKALGNPRPFDIANQWAGSFGGPIKKDKPPRRDGRKQRRKTSRAIQTTRKSCAMGGAAPSAILPLPDVLSGSLCCCINRPSLRGCGNCWKLQVIEACTYPETAEGC